MFSWGTISDFPIWYIHLGTLEINFHKGTVGSYKAGFLINQRSNDKKGRRATEYESSRVWGEPRKGRNDQRSSGLWVGLCDTIYQNLRADSRDDSEEKKSEDRECCVSLWTFPIKIQQNMVFIAERLPGWQANRPSFRMWGKNLT